MSTARLVAIIAGIVVLGISLFPLGLAGLAFLGGLIDAGVDENRRMGFALLKYGVPLGLLGLGLCVVGLALRR